MQLPFVWHYQYWSELISCIWWDGIFRVYVFRQGVGVKWHQHKKQCVMINHGRTVVDTVYLIGWYNNIICCIVIESSCNDRQKENDVSRWFMEGLSLMRCIWLDDIVVSLVVSQWNVCGGFGKLKMEVGFHFWRGRWNMSSQIVLLESDNQHLSGSFHGRFLAIYDAALLCANVLVSLRHAPNLAKWKLPSQGTTFRFFVPT